MPTYDYECKACGHVFETMHSMSAPVLRKCPKCGKLKLRRLISGGAGVIFKGSGFYETDYKRNRRGADSASKTDGDGKSSGASKSEEGSKTESKNEPSSDAKSESKSDSKEASKPKSDGDSASKPKKDSGAKRD